MYQVNEIVAQDALGLHATHSMSGKPTGTRFVYKASGEGWVGALVLRLRNVHAAHPFHVADLLNPIMRAMDAGATRQERAAQGAHLASAMAEMAEGAPVTCVLPNNGLYATHRDLRNHVARSTQDVDERSAVQPAPLRAHET